MLRALMLLLAVRGCARPAVRVVLMRSLDRRKHSRRVRRTATLAPSKRERPIGLTLFGSCAIKSRERYQSLGIGFRVHRRGPFRRVAVGRAAHLQGKAARKPAVARPISIGA